MCDKQKRTSTNERTSNLKKKHDKIRSRNIIIKDARRTFTFDICFKYAYNDK